MPEEEQRIMSKYSIEVLEKCATKYADFAKATKILKQYMKDLGLLK